MWINVHMNHFRHGVMLEDLAQPVRDLALEIVRATMSHAGTTRLGRSCTSTSWSLSCRATMTPSANGRTSCGLRIAGVGRSWGWQIDGHHLCVNTVVFDGRIVMTPTFMGSEPRRVRLGSLAGLSLFDPEEQLGLDLIRSLPPHQRQRAILHPSLHPDEISPSLQNAFDGRMQAGAFHDNLVAPYQGVRAPT